MGGPPPPPEWRMVRVVGPTGVYSDSPFMLDSGADIGLIPAAIAYRLQLEAWGEASVSGVGGTQRQEVVEAKIYVEGVGPFDVQMIVTPNVRALGRDIIAQIGMVFPGSLEA